MKFFAPCPPGAERVLAAELTDIGASAVRTGMSGVSFEGDLHTAYRASLDLRTASRLLWELRSGDAPDEEELYRIVNSHPWEKEFSPEATIACRVTGVPGDHDPRYATLKVKDGVVDRFKEKEGVRPDVERRFPDLRIEARWDGRRATVYLNWSGPPLHERGYRLDRTDAVLRETTAAALLAQSGWPAIAADGGSFVDPVCGSGTLLAEAAMMASGAPVGFRRKSWGFEKLSAHDENLWRELLNDARIRFGESLRNLPRIVGYDNDRNALRTAASNLRRAGLNQVVRLEFHDITTGRAESWPMGETGLIFADPPYGVRMESDPSEIYAGIGNVFRTLDTGWRMALLAPDKKTAAASYLRADDYRYTVSGGLNLVLALYRRLGGKPIQNPAENRSSKDRNRDNRGPEDKNRNPADRIVPERIPQTGETERPAPDPKKPSLHKALERNLKALAPWAEKSGVSSYRIWDSEMPEFNAAVDWYEGRWLHVQEFAPPGKVAPETARQRLITLLDVLKELTGCEDENLYLKTRQKGIRPYVKLGNTRDRFIIRENGRKFFINLIDYLDTGIFLDHRTTRSMIEKRSEGVRFLNLFSYTGTASVMAAAGGAKRTVSVDVSNTYLDWARDNMKLNGLDSRSHSYFRADSFDYLKNSQDSFDLIFIDPPTYSNGTGRDDWSVQDDHGALIRFAMKKLTPGGTILFSENSRRFEIDNTLKRDFSLREITRETTPPDYAKRNRAHRCWEIGHLS